MNIAVWPTLSDYFGFDDSFRVPVSRWTEVPRAAIAGEADLVILADSDIAGVCLAQDRAGRNIYMFNHFEYGRYLGLGIRALRPAARQRCRPIIFPATTRRGRRAIRGAAMLNCFMAIGSMRSIR